jgi:chromate transport protein ChrA
LRQSSRGQTFSFFIVVIAILVGAVLVFFDKSAEGIATILVPLASIIAIFAYRETQSAREGKEQQDPPT